MQDLQNSCSYFFVQGSQSGLARGPQFTHFKMATAKLKKRSYPNLLIVDLLQAAMPQEFYRTILHFHKI